MANYMKEVAKLLGLEIEETSRIKGEEPYFRFMVFANGYSRSTTQGVKMIEQ